MTATEIVDSINKYYLGLATVNDVVVISENSANASIKQFQLNGVGIRFSYVGEGFSKLIVPKQGKILKGNPDGIIIYESGVVPHVVICELKSSDLSKAVGQVIAGYLKFCLLMNLFSKNDINALKFHLAIAVRDSANFSSKINQIQQIDAKKRSTWERFIIRLHQKNKFDEELQNVVAPDYVKDISKNMLTQKITFCLLCSNKDTIVTNICNI